jgi:hypothetical protein
MFLSMLCIYLLQHTHTHAHTHTCTHTQKQVPRTWEFLHDKLTASIAGGSSKFEPTKTETEEVQQLAHSDSCA